MSMMHRPMWPFLLMYGGLTIWDIGFLRVDGGQRDTPGFGLSHDESHLIHSM